MDKVKAAWAGLDVVFKIAIVVVVAMVLFG